jgi:fatty acid desaturase
VIELRRELHAIDPSLGRLRRHPFQLATFGALAAAIVALSLVIIRLVGEPGLSGWATALACSVLLGVVWASMGLWTHELLHGSIIKTRWLSHLIAIPGFLLFGLSPELWLTWHNRAHHHQTNVSGKDPDTFGLWNDLKDMPMIGFVMKRAPGSCHWLSWIYLPLNFSNQVLTVMWFFLWKGDRRLFATARRPLAVAETLFTYVFWAWLAWAIGGKAWLVVFLVPMLVANLIVSSYILTTHLLSPLTPSGEVNDPLENSLGVTTFAWLDALHFRFGHHVEHHLYPYLNHCELPAVRATLRRLHPDRYRCMPHSTAIRLLLTTPRAYRDRTTLWDPVDGRTFDVSRLGRG